MAKLHHWNLFRRAKNVSGKCFGRPVTCPLTKIWCRQCLFWRFALRLTNYLCSSDEEGFEDSDDDIVDEANCLYCKICTPDCLLRTVPYCCKIRFNCGRGPKPRNVVQNWTFTSYRVDLGGKCEKLDTLHLIVFLNKKNNYSVANITVLSRKMLGFSREGVEILLDMEGRRILML